MKEFYKVSLKPYHTFGIDLDSNLLIEIESVSDTNLIISKGYFKRDFYILGGGSNVLFKKIPEIIFKVSIKGIEIVKEEEDNIWIKVYAGEVWDDFVRFCVEKNYGGIENLSLIPGTSGAAPVQNIGAYGMEVKDSLESLSALNIDTGVISVFKNEECRFSYRDSIFKHKENGRWLILDTTYKLTKRNHRFVLNYGNIAPHIGNIECNLSLIREIVCEQRNSKLPDCKVLGNAGSFFKNPVVPISKYEQLKKIHENIPSFSFSKELVKIPAAWFIEKSGMKGYRKEQVGTHIMQPLVIVNYGGATTQDILDFADLIISEVYKKFDIRLEMEVNLVN